MSTAKRNREQADSDKTASPNKRPNTVSDAMDPDANGVYQLDPDGDLVLYIPGYCFKADDKKNDAVFLVSSKHMTLASPWFKASLSDRWSRGQSSTDRGRIKIAIDNCKPDTLLILLLIIHGFSRKVPRQIQFQQLADISLTVDFYQCAEVVEPFVLAWVKEPNLDLPSETSKNLLKWIMVAWVFKLDNLLSEATKFAAETSTGSFKTENLPIPTFIADGIDKSRKKSLTETCAGIQARILELSSNVGGLKCNVLLLGHLVQHMIKQHACIPLFALLPNPTASDPLLGLSVSNIRYMINSFKFKPNCFCECSNHYYTRCDNQKAPWGETVYTSARTACAGVKMS